MTEAGALARGLHPSDGLRQLAEVVFCIARGGWAVCQTRGLRRERAGRPTRASDLALQRFAAGLHPKARQPLAGSRPSPPAGGPDVLRPASPPESPGRTELSSPRGPRQADGDEAAVAPPPEEHSAWTHALVRVGSFCDCAQCGSWARGAALRSHCDGRPPKLGQQAISRFGRQLHPRSGQPLQPDTAPLGPP